MTNATLLSRLDMQRRLASCRSTVMAGLAIRIARSMAECGRQPSCCRFVAGIALCSRKNVTGRFSGRSSAMAVGTTTGRRRHQRAVIYPRRQPSGCFVAIAAILGSLDVCCRLARLCCTVMAGGTGLR